MGSIYTGKCQRDGCSNGATHRPILKMRAYEGSKIANAPLTLAVCKPCADSLDVDDLLTDKGWVTILRGFILRAVPPPSRELCEIEWVRDGSGPSSAVA